MRDVKRMVVGLECRIRGMVLITITVAIGLVLVSCDALELTEASYERTGKCESKHSRQKISLERLSFGDDQVSLSLAAPLSADARPENSGVIIDSRNRAGVESQESLPLPPPPFFDEESPNAIVRWEASGDRIVFNVATHIYVVSADGARLGRMLDTHRDDPRLHLDYFAIRWAWSSFDMAESNDSLVFAALENAGRTTTPTPDVILRPEDLLRNSPLPDRYFAYEICLMQLGSGDVRRITENDDFEFFPRVVA